MIVGLIIPCKTNCCTTAIFSGKVTQDGRPIIWKNRDSSFEQNRVEYVPAGGDVKYSFIYLSNSAPTKEAWSGVNSVGFSIMNSVSYNIRKEGDTTPANQMDKEGFVMYDALAVCETLQDFENMLDRLAKPMGIEANFGVIDAYGGAAYYEVNNFSWQKFDINDSPEGYIVRSNYSFSGREGEGQGYVRYDNAKKVIEDRMKDGNKIDTRFVMDSLSRNFYQSELGFNPISRDFDYFVDKDFIPRRSTVSVSIIQGVNPGEDSSLAVMWCALGYPPVSQIVPLMVSAGKYIPADFRATEKSINSSACNRALKRKEKVFFTNDSGRACIDLRQIKQNIKEISGVEDKIYRDFFEMLDYWRECNRVDTGQLESFYEGLEIR